jgi:hypothetical protein
MRCGIYAFCIACTCAFETFIVQELLPLDSKESRCWVTLSKERNRNREGVRNEQSEKSLINILFSMSKRVTGEL